MLLPKEQSLEDRRNALADVVVKSPRNGRGLMNYGGPVEDKGDFAGALEYLHRAQQLMPQHPSY